MGTLLDELLGSYSDIRKRNWKPSLMLESNPNQLYGMGKDWTGDVNQYRDALQRLKGQVEQFIQNPTAYMQNDAATAMQAVQGAGEKFQFASYPGGFVVGGAGSAQRFGVKGGGAGLRQPAIIQSFIDKEHKEPKGKEGKDDDTNKREPSIEGENLQAGVVFAPEEIDSLRDSYRRTYPDEGEKGFDKWMGAVTRSLNLTDNEKVCEKLAAYQSAETEGDKAKVCTNITAEAQQELKQAVMQLASIRSKVTEVTVNGERKLILKLQGTGSLTADEAALLKCVTIRGENQDKGIHVGDLACDNANLQALRDVGLQAQSGNYGFGLGNYAGDDKLAPLARILKDVKVFPGRLPDISEMSQEDWDGLDDATNKSTSVANREVGDMSNNTRGLLYEGVHMLSIAGLTDDKGVRKAALAELKEDIERACGAASLIDSDAVLNTHQSNLIDAAYDIAGDDCAKGILDEMKTMVKASHATNEALGLTSDSIQGVERPSKESLAGHRADLVITLKPGASVPPGLKEYTTCEGKGADAVCTVEISSKFYKNGFETIRAGATSVRKSFDPEFEGYDEVATLREVGYDKAELSSEQRKECRSAQEKDEKMYAETKKLIGRLSPANVKSTSEYLDMVEADGPPNLPEDPQERKKVQVEWEGYINSIKDRLKKEPRQAAMMIFQLRRLSEAKSSPAYARGMAFNSVATTIGGMGNETLSVGTPSTTRVFRVDDVIRLAGDEIFGKGSAKVSLSGVSVFNSDKQKIVGATVRGKRQGKGVKENQEGQITKRAQETVPGKTMYTGGKTKSSGRK